MSPSQDSHSKGATAAPKRWTHDELVQFLTEKRLVGSKGVPSELDGRKIMRMTKLQLRNCFYEDAQIEKADLLYQLLRTETNRASRLELKRRIAITSRQVSPIMAARKNERSMCA